MVALSEDFEQGAAGTAVETTGTVLTAISGTGSATYIENGYLGTMGVRTATTAGLKTLRADFTPDGPWYGFYFQPVTLPNLDHGLLQVAQGVTIAATLRFNAAGTLTYRDGTVAQYTTPAVAAGTGYWVAVRFIPGTTTGGRLKVYNAATGALLADSGDLTSNAIVITAVDNVRLGALSGNPTVEETLDRFRLGFTTEPTLPATSSPTTVVVEATPQPAVPYGLVTLTATPSGGTAPYTYAWTQAAGDAVTLAGTGATRTFTAPAGTTARAYTFQVTVTPASGAAVIETVTANVLSHNHWTKVGGVLAPRRRWIKKAGVVGPP